MHADRGLPLTGERTVPGVPEENYWFRRHEAAYAFAGGLVEGRILDVGVGEGYGAAMLVGDGSTVVATELDAPTALHAATRYEGVGVIRADACALPFAGNAFRAIVSMQVLEHLWCPERFVERARDILEPGGALVLSTPNRATFSPQGVRNPFHTHEYTADELERLLSATFDHVEVRGVRHGVYLRSLDVLGAGSLQHLLMDTPHADLPSKVRLGIGLVRARHFTVGDAEGSLDLLAIAR
jgi:SAM-dependent methyltransferase